MSAIDPVADIRAAAIVTGMEHASLVAFLEGTLPPEQLSAEVGEEVSACNEAFRSGGIGYIAVTDGPRTIVNRDHAKRLLEAVADQRLTFEVANYAADCIIMSDDFEFADDAVNEAIYFVEDDSVVPTVAEVRTAIQRLAP
ncbi:MAG TPA: hypothetical protein VHG29_07710 [Novosphingobium sp.]|nr:hypothetical protein [Novosphingobium sp.]